MSHTPVCVFGMKNYAMDSMQYRTNHSVVIPSYVCHTVNKILLALGCQQARSGCMVVQDLFDPALLHGWLSHSGC
jgi:hypothetical protein